MLIRPMRDFLAPGFPPELMLAIACARWPLDESARREIELRAGVTLDWTLFLAWIERHGIGPLAHHNLRQAGSPLIPPPVLAELASRYARNVKLVLRQIAEAQRIQRTLNEAGIGSILIKGPVLSMIAFGDPALRASRDIDLLVAPVQLREADRLIRDAGYRRFAPDFELTPRQHALHERFRCQFGYHSEVSGLVVELHWRLTSNARLFRLDEGVLGERSRRVSLGGGDFRTLPSEDLFLYLCVHGGMHVWFRLKWLADIAALLRGAAPGFIESVAERANSLGIARPVRQALVLAQSLLDAPAPESVLRSAARDRATRGLVTAAYRALAWGGLPSEPAESRWFNMWVGLQAYRLRAEPAYLWAEFQDQLCSPEDWARLPLPEWLSFLYLPFRPISWAARKLRHAIVR
ncbi:MAG TPA: nucleotidyltransferase family protein [Stellaceae bacterium]|nr:nucleotidyltransferase family protein [Stellaceae bacterium]